jgi:hypothetical protein
MSEAIGALEDVFNPEPGQSDEAGKPDDFAQEGLDEAGAQSELDKLRAANEQLTREKQELESVAPLARYVDKHPAVLDHLEMLLETDPNGASASEKGEPLPPLEKPTKPSDFDPQEASDPNTPSGAYWMQLQEYNAEANTRILSNQTQDADTKKKVRENIQKEKADSDQQAKTTTRLREVYGLEADEVKEFWELMTQPDSLNEENMVKFYKAIRPPREGGEAPTPEPEKPPAPNQEDPRILAQQERLAKEAKALGLRLEIPESAAIGSGAESGEKTEAEGFVDSLVSEKQPGLIF